MPRRATIAPRPAPVERAQLGKPPIQLPVRAPRRQSCCAARRPWSGFRRVYAPASPWLLARARPAASPSERRPSVIPYSAILWGVLSQALRRSVHELVTFGGVYGWRLYGRGDAVGEIGDMFTESVAGVQVA